MIRLVEPLHHLVAAPFAFGRKPLVKKALHALYLVLIEIRVAAIFTQHDWLEWPIDGSNF